MAVESLEYPVHLGLAYLFLVGYLFRSAFVWAHLPGAVGVIFSGVLFARFMQSDLLTARDELQGLAFFLVLLTAGFETTLADMRLHVLVYALVPGTCELLGIAAYAVNLLGFTHLEGLVLGASLFCIGDGLVIPRMTELGRQYPGCPMPRLVVMLAPLEASYALTLFGVLQGVADPDRPSTVNMRLVLGANALRLLATGVVGGLLGSMAGWLIPRREAARIRGKTLFTGAIVEAYLMILAVALAGFGLGAAVNRHVVVSMGVVPGPMFQPELLVIVIGSFFAHVVDPGVLHSLEGIVGGVWVFGQLVLFSMLGSHTDVSVLTHAYKVLPLMFVGIFCRFVGMVLATFGTLWMRPCTCEACRQRKWDTALLDATFCFLSSLPRATIQGALGPTVLAKRFFSDDPGRAHVDVFIANAARLYVVCMSIGGSILLDAYGPRMLQMAEDVSSRFYCRMKGDRETPEAGDGWASSPPAARASDDEAEGEELERAIGLLAGAFGVGERDVLLSLELLRGNARPPGPTVRFALPSEEPPAPTRHKSVPEGLGGSPGRRQTKCRTAAASVTASEQPQYCKRVMSFSQFEARGDATARSAWRPEGYCEIESAAPECGDVLPALQPV